MTREVDNIVRDINHMRADNDFSFVSQQVRELQRHDPQHWRQNIAEINQRVDLRQLGFPEDFTIVGVDNHGNVNTISQDGQRAQQRDRVHLQVQGDRENAPTREHWGRRDFTANTDNTATYTVRPGDNVWQISRDVLNNRGGQPSNAAIARMVEEIRQENHMPDANILHPGQVLRIPEARPVGELPARIPPGADLSAENVRVRGDRYTAVAPAGLDFDATGNVRDAHVDQRTLVREQRADGLLSRNYSGYLNDAVLGGVVRRETPFTADQTTDRNGNLMSSRIEYGRGGAPTMNFDNGRGSTETIQNVQTITTRHNSVSGQYETEITTANGGRYAAASSRDGRVLSLRQTRAADAPVDMLANMPPMIL